MSIKKIFTLFIVVLLIPMFAFSQSVRESFEYPSTIAGLGIAGNGFGGPWVIDTSYHGTEGKAVVAGNVFSYMDLNYEVPDTGNHVQATLVNAWGDAQRYMRPLAETHPNVAGETYWVSYLLDIKTAPENDTYFMIKLYSTENILSGSGELLAIGKSGGQVTPVYSCGSGAGTNWGGPPEDVSAVDIQGGPVWLVVRIDMSGPEDTVANDRTYMWVDPDPTTEPDTNFADVKRNTDMPDGFNAIALEYGGNVGAEPIQLIFDEIKISSNYDDLSSETAAEIRESFEYPSTIAGLGVAGNGFGGPWVIDTSYHGTEGKAVVAGNVFSYMDLNYEVPDTGNHVQATLVNAWGDAQRYMRPLAETWPNVAGETYWVSYLLDIKTAPENDTYFMIKLYSTENILSGSGELLAIGKSGGQVTPVYSCGSGAGTNWGGPPEDVSAVDIQGGPVWLVVRIDMSGPEDTVANDRTYMWVDPDPTTEPDTNFADVKRNTDMPDGFNAIALEYGGNVGAEPIQLIFDEIRLGTSFDDVSAPIITDVKNEIVKPNVYNLSQNYPNPFNPTTTISYTLQKPGTVTLKVYDILGRVIAELINNEFTPAGSYKINFNAADLSSGTYFYQLQTGDFVETKKMLLLK